MLSKLFARKAAKPAPAEPVKPKSFRYAPKEDITAFEVAQLVEYLLRGRDGEKAKDAYARMPETLKRHINLEY